MGELQNQTATAPGFSGRAGATVFDARVLVAYILGVLMIPLHVSRILHMIWYEFGKGWVMRRWLAGVLLGGLTGAGHPAWTQEVRITPDRADSNFTVNGQSFTITRDQNQENQLTGEFTRTSRACPPFCIQPAQIAPDVATIAELEVLGFLETEVAQSTGLLIDSRLPDWFAKGSIPAAVNVPFATLDATNPYRTEILQALGATGTPDDLDFSGALDLVLFSNGPWDDQAARAALNLLEAGYPAEKLQFYRGGLQEWLLLGLTVAVPAQAG